MAKLNNEFNLFVVLILQLSVILCFTSCYSNKNIKISNELYNKTIYSLKNNCFFNLNKNGHIIRCSHDIKLNILSKKFNVKNKTIISFYKIIILNKKVSIAHLEEYLFLISSRHNELLARLKQFNLLVSSEIHGLIKKVEQAIVIGDYDQADTYLDDIIKIQLISTSQLSKKFNNCKLSSAESKIYKGCIEMIRFNYKAATQHFKKAVELVPNGYDLIKAEYLQKLANAARYASLYNDSQTALEKCLSIRETTLPKESLDLATTINSMAMLYESQEKYAEVEPLYKRVLYIKEKVLGKNHSDTIKTLNKLALLYGNKREYAKAINLYKISLDRTLKRINNKEVKDESILLTFYHLSLLHYIQGNFIAEAELIYNKILEIYKKYPNNIDANISITPLNDLAGLYRSEGKYSKSESLYKIAWKIRESSLGKNHLSISIILDNLGQLYSSRGNYSSAELFYKKTLQIKESALGKYHLNIASTLNNLAQLYRSRGKNFEANNYKNRALEILYLNRDKFDRDNYNMILERIKH